MGTTKESRKSWWDRRNIHDPFYLYMTGNKEKLKVQRLDFGIDGTQLAIEWAAENKTAALTSKLSERIFDAYGQNLQVLFARHQIEGTASSPNIRASEIFRPSPEYWAFDADDKVLTKIQDQAKQIQELHDAVTDIFREKSKKEKEAEDKKKWFATVLEGLKDRKKDASNAFWRNMTSVYQDILDAVRSAEALGATASSAPMSEDDGPGQFELPDDIRQREVEAALAAFDEVANPHATQESVRIAFVRGRMRKKLWGIANPIPTKENK